MARDIQTIKTSIDGQLTSNLADAGITLSASAVAEWKLWRDTIANADFTFETIMDVFKADVQAYIDSKQPGSLAWYAQAALDFQFGDDLQVDKTGRLYYPVIDAAKKVVKLASVRESEDMGSGVVTLVIKVANVVDDVVTPLTDEQLLGIADYFKSKKIVGTKLQTVSAPADVVFYDMLVAYNPEYAVSNVEDNIQAALLAFKENFGFDPILYRSSFEFAVKSAAGVVAVGINDLKATPDGGTIEDVDFSYELQAGYFEYDNSSIITLQPA